MKTLLSAILLFTCVYLQATHVVGGNFEITQTGRNEFKIDLIIFRDVKGEGTLPEIMYAGLYRKSNWSFEKMISLREVDRKPVVVGEACFRPEELQFQEVRYSLTTNLPDDAQGYYLTTEYCCRNALIGNMVVDDQNTGITFTAEIASPALAGGNHSPQMGAYPTAGFFCVNQIREIDLSATDPDGDSLVYNLVIPLDADGVLSPPPYTQMEYLPGYSYQNTLGANPPLTIDAQTGILSGLAPQINVYLFSYSVSEYRNGNKIGEVRRDIQFYSLACEPDAPPYFTGVTDSIFTLNIDEEFCPNVNARDVNPLDTMTVSYVVDGFLPSNESLVLGKPRSFGKLNASLCWTPTCYDAFVKTDFKVTATVRSACDSASFISKNYYFTVDAVNAKADDFAPNVLTPNGDGINDFFRIRTQEAAPCIEDFSIHIFNRWGALVYKGSRADLGWDGLINGQKAAEGVYYYTLRGIYRDQSFEFKSFLTLFY